MGDKRDKNDGNISQKFWKKKKLLKTFKNFQLVQAFKVIFI
jgi:hypothetical protein